MLAKRFPQCPVQEVGRGVVAHDLMPAAGVDSCRGRLPDANLSRGDRSHMSDRALSRLLRVFDPDASTRRGDGSGVADLAAGLAVKGGALEKDLDSIAFCCALGRTAIYTKGDHLRL